MENFDNEIKEVEAREITEIPEMCEIPESSEASKTPEASENKKRSSLKTVLLCFLCAIIGGFMALLGGFVFNKYLKSPDQPSQESRKSTIIENKDVTINVKDVNSPAVAVAEKVLPSIVGIRVTSKKQISSWFFGTQETESTGEGSGIVYSADGYIITNYHVISDALTSAGEKAASSTLTVYLYTDPETPVDAEIIGYDIGSDLAVLKIKKNGLKPIEIGNSDEIKQGDISMAVGNPGGLKFLGSISQGIISGLNRTITVENTYENISLIQTDAAINPGNSGGALVNVSGQLIGVNSVKLVSDGYEGMGFAIPINYVLSVVEDIIKNKDSVRIYFGIEENTDYTAELLEKNGFPGGIVVKSVAKDSPAEAGGIEEWDIIVSFKGEAVRTMADLNKVKQKCLPGEQVSVRVYRAEGRKYNFVDLTITLA